MNWANHEEQKLIAELLSSRHEKYRVRTGPKLRVLRENRGSDGDHRYSVRYHLPTLPGHSGLDNRNHLRALRCERHSLEVCSGSGNLPFNLTGSEPKCGRYAGCARNGSDLPQDFPCVPNPYLGSNPSVDSVRVRVEGFGCESSRGEI